MYPSYKYINTFMFRMFLYDNHIKWFSYRFKRYYKWVIVGVKGV